MGTLEEQTRAYEAALVYFENLRADQNGLLFFYSLVVQQSKVYKSHLGPYKLGASDLRNIQALINQATHGAFRQAPQDSKQSLGTREKQAWEALGNVPKTEGMRRLVDKIEHIKRDVDIAVNAAKHQSQQ